MLVTQGLELKPELAVDDYYYYTTSWALDTVNTTLHISQQTFYCIHKAAPWFESSHQVWGIQIPETEIKLQVPKYKQIIFSWDLPNVLSQRLFKKCIRRFVELLVVFGNNPISIDE